MGAGGRSLVISPGGRRGPTVELVIDTSDAETQINRYARGVYGALQKALERGGPKLRDLVAKAAPKRSWHLADSIEFIVDDLTLEIFTDVPYARLQEEGSAYLPGGVIRPREAQNLAIPLPAADAHGITDPEGGPGAWARDVIAHPESFGFVDTFFAGEAIFGVEQIGDERDAVPIFALKPFVEVPAANKGKGYLRITVLENFDIISDLAVEELDKLGQA